MGGSLSNIQNLIAMPYGCGEQNMINFAPDVYINMYLENAGKLTPAVKETLEGYISHGYIKELQ